MNPYPKSFSWGFALLLVGALSLGSGLPARAQTVTLEFTNAGSAVLDLLASEGMVEGEQVDELGHAVGNLTLDTATSAVYADDQAPLRAGLALDGGRDLYRFEGVAECAGLLEVSFLQADGSPLTVRDARVVVASPDSKGSYLGQAVTTVTTPTTGERLLARAGSAQVDVRFALGSDGRGRAATFSQRYEVQVGCDQVVTLDVMAGDTAAVLGASDVVPGDGSEALPVRRDARDLLDAELSNGSDATPKSSGAGAAVSKANGDGTTSFCTDETFDGTTLPAIWGFDLLGDALTGSASLTGTGRLSLTGTGTSLYHDADNGGYVYRGVDGDFRAEVTLVDVPVNQGGDFRKSGLMVRESVDPNSARVMVQLVVDHPVYNTTALQFDFRNKAGDALELASTPVDVSLPLRVAVDRRGDVFTAYYSTDNGQSWIKPLGGVGQGQIEIAMGSTALVGMTATSYDNALPLTVEYDDFQLCTPNADPAPTLPPVAGCLARPKLDLYYLVDSSGSMTAAFPGADSKLAAVAAAVADANDTLGTNFPGSRAALVTYRGAVFSDPVYNVTQGAQVLTPLTTDLTASTAAIAAIDPTQIHPDANTPAPIALDLTTQDLVLTHAPDFLPVVIWLTDGAPNIDINGQGPLEYRFPEILPLEIRDGGGDFLPWGQVAWLGNYNGGIDTYDGEVFANTMFQIENLKDTVPDALIYPVAIRGEDTFYEDLMAYAAAYTGTELFTVDDTSGLAAALDDILSVLDCGATIGDYVWLDTNGDGVQDASEVGIAGVTVELRDGTDTVLVTTTTDADGGYLFENVVPGTYTVTVDPSTLPAEVEGPTYDYDGIETAHAAVVTVAEGEEQLDVDFGYLPAGTGGGGDECVEGTFRDDFDTASFGNQDGSLDWSGDWIEDDPTGAGVGSGQVQVHDGFLTLDDNPDTGAEPSAERSADLSFADGATLSFEFATSHGVDHSDAVTVEISNDGGATWTVLEVIDGIDGSRTEERSYDIGAFIAEDVRVRFRVSNKYGGHDELFCIDWIEIVGTCEQECTGSVQARDDFDTASFSNQDGATDWSGDWIEHDPTGNGVGSGQVQVHDGFLTLDDNPDTGAHPSAERQVDLSGVGSATLSFAFATSHGVDRSDAVTVEISDDGGATWTVLEVIDDIDGSHTGERTYDISAFASSETRVRFRVSRNYGGHHELFCIDWIEIVGDCDDDNGGGGDGFPGDHYEGRLTCRDDSDFQPDGSYYWAESGRQEAWLEGEGRDFDLYLYRWSGSRWKKVARSEGNDSSEHIAYDGPSGYYTWEVRSYRGHGDYDLWISTP